MYKIYRYTSPLLVLLALGFTTSLHAQKQITHQSQYWIRYYGKYHISHDWETDVEIDDRRFFKDNRQANWVLPRITVIRKLGAGWNIGAGFTYYTTTNPADPEKAATLTVPELRPHEELNYSQKIGKLGIKQRFKLEQRWTHNSTATELTHGYSFKGRFRYQFQLDYRLITSATGSGSLSAKTSDEILLNLGHSVVNNTFDQNRFYVALNYELSKAFQVELGYMDYFQQRSSGNQYYQRDIARLTIYHSVNFFK